MKLVIKLISDLKYHVLDLNDVRAKCDHCGMYQRPYWNKKLAKREAAYCEYCGHRNVFLYEFKPIKINCKWCNPKGLVLSKELPIKDYVVLA